jgi:hypothetical protein
VGQSLAVFVDQLQPGSHAEIATRLDVPLQMLDAIVKGASATTLIPALGDIPLLV